MKKMLWCFVCIGIFAVFFASTQDVQAKSTQSKVTGTLIAPKSSSDKEKASGHKTGELPKTGEESSLSFAILGLSFIAIGAGTWYLKKEKRG